MEPHQVDGFVAACRIARLLDHDAAVRCGRGDRVEDDGRLDLEDFFALLDEQVEGVVDMALVGKLVEDVLDAGPRPDGRVFCDPEHRSDPVRRDEADAENVLGEPVGVFAHYGDRVFAVLLEYLHRVGGAHAMPLQEDHHVPYLFLRLPGFAYHPDPLFPYAVDLPEPLYIAVDHVEGLYGELRDEPFSHDGTDAFDHARAQVALYAGDGGGHDELRRRRS